MRAALLVESLKLRRSLVGVMATALLVGGILALVTGMMSALATGDPRLTAKLGPSATLDWPGLVSIAAQIIGAGGLLGFGVVIAWLFAREFSDATISGLFALPIGRGTIAAAKLAVFVLWSATVSVLTAAAMLALGVLLGFGFPDDVAWAGLGRLVVLEVLTAAVAIPVAWVATVTRSLLAGVASAVGLVIVAQVGVVVGAGGWMPLAAPALWAISAGTAVTALQLSLPVMLAAFAAATTVWTWQRLQLDR